MVCRAVTRIVQVEGYNVSEAKRAIEELEVKASHTEERAKQELTAQRDGFMRAAAEYAEQARGVCAVEVEQAECRASRQHDHTVNLIRRAAEMQLGDQRQNLMKELVAISPVIESSRNIILEDLR